MNRNKQYREDLIRAVEAVGDIRSLAGKTLLITGASGMIASVMIDILMQYNQTNPIDGDGIRVIAVSRNEAKARDRFLAYWEHPLFCYYSHDISVPLPELGKVDYILHAASNTHPRAYATDPIGTITANVTGTYELLSYGAAHQCNRFLCFSSVEVYGESRQDVEKFDETYLGYIDCNTLRAGYPESKRLAESLCNAFASQKGQDFVIGRFSRVYGPTMGAEDSKAIAQFIRKAAAGEDIVLKSEGRQLYSYTYVVDAAAAALFLLLHGKSGEAYNVSDEDSEIALRDLAAILADSAGTKVVFELPDAVEQAGYSTATKALLDASKLKTLGWKPLTPIAEGLEKTVRILRETE